MKTMNFYVRGDAVVFRCETCSGELPVDPNAPFMPQLLQISRTHECLRNARVPVARSRPDLHVVPDPRDGDAVAGADSATPGG